MSDVAASGGYYMAMGCDYIYAYPNTITGSIGVFGLSVELDQFLEKKLGITSDYVSTGNYSSLGSPLRKMADKDSMIIQKSVERIYDEFISKAAKGRNLTKERIDEIASGRVWSGKKAKEIGLVDELGNLDSAIVKMTQLAELSVYSIEYYPKSQSILEQLSNDLDAKYGKESIIKSLKIGEDVYSKLEFLNQMDNIQARMPFEMNID